LNLDEITGTEAHALTETQAIRAKEVNVNISGTAMAGELEMMVLNVSQAMAHFCFSGANWF
jgi:hypothetical protein